MGAIQGAINQIIGSVAAGVALSGKLGKQSQAKEPNIDLQMRDKALKQAQQKIDAINKQNLGRNTRMKQIRGVIDEFSKQDFTVKEGGKK